MHFISSLQSLIHSTQLPVISIIGLVTIVGFYFGRMTNRFRLPSILGYMFLGAIIGPSFLDLLSTPIQSNLVFISQMALGIVAVSIGLELKFMTLKQLGPGIVYAIFAESFGAFIIVFIAVYFLTGNLPLALIFAGIAPASAPAGTVAVIREYRAKGLLTKALYAVVGFDDGLGIIIFGFSASIAKRILLHEVTAVDISFWSMMFSPLKEIIASIILGTCFAYVLKLLVLKMTDERNIFIIIFGCILFLCGICTMYHLSYILTNLVFGIVIVNRLPTPVVQKIEDQFRSIMPLLFLLFFTLAGANLHIDKLFSLGLLGCVYAVSRSTGLISGAYIGATIGKMEKKIRRYLGLGILSQAGVAIGLALIVKIDFAGIGKTVTSVSGESLTKGDLVGISVITTITATCIFFEIIGPILTKIALKKAGEIE